MTKFLPFSTISRVKKFFEQKIFGGHLIHMETQLHAKNQKLYRTVKAVGPEWTYERTNERTRVNV